MAGLLSAHADEYAYLTFMTTDGIKASVKVSSLKLTISGTTLTAGTKSFTLANLSKMYFSATDETTGIQQLTVKAMEDVTDIYDLQGRKVSKEQMRNGAYIIKTKQGTYKIIVK
ncbi:MAG TPA: hypothetical protein DCG33_03820 [Prevotellaceae bacterium]|nr:hypothetical protein [Prevotellaceae bacterium]